MPTKENGQTDWSKIFMGAAVALVFIMQQYHAMQISDVKANVVPRAEYEEKHKEVMHKDEITLALKVIAARMDRIEERINK